MRTRHTRRASARAQHPRARAAIYITSDHGAIKCVLMHLMTSSRARRVTGRVAWVGCVSKHARVQIQSTRSTRRASSSSSSPPSLDFCPTLVGHSTTVNSRQPPRGIGGTILCLTRRSRPKIEIVSSSFERSPLRET